MKIRNKTYLFLAVLIFFVVGCFIVHFEIFASKGDWLSQHSVFPDYFRQQFYATGQLFPEFAAGLGGGQNIYNFSYYGLYSPIILPSYLLPFVKMSDYLSGVGIICLFASVMLMYYWLGTHRFSNDIRLFVTVIFLFAAPMLYQLHRQIMFVDYMPFLCMALIGVDRYWQKGKTGLYTAGVFLMIMTSFYFSIGGILALLLYGISRYQKTRWRWPAVRFLLPVAAAVCSAGILLIPTAYVLLSRSGSSQKNSFLSLILPDFSFIRFAYSGYGIGLTAGILTVLFLGIICRNKKVWFLSAGCLLVLTIPFFSWLLNGGLYAREKALIPFLPVLCYLTALCMDAVKKKKVSARMYLAGYLLTVLWCVLSFLIQEHGKWEVQSVLMLAELGLMILFFVLYQRTKLLPMLFVPTVFCLILSGAAINLCAGDWIEKEFYDSVTDESWAAEISDILKKESGLFRLEQGGGHEEKSANINRIWDIRQWSSSVYSSAYQEEYKNFRENIFQTEQPFRNCLMQSASENPLFQKFMGVKYWVKKNGAFTVDVQEHAAPVIYATNRMISKEAYQKLPFPYNQTALMKYAVTEEKGDVSAEEIISSLPALSESEIAVPETSAVQKTEDGYAVRSKKTIKTTISVLQEKDAAEERLFYIQFDVKNEKKEKDVIVELAGIRNNVSAEEHIYYNGNTTFTYVVKLEKNQREIEAVFGKGEYSVSNIKCFLGDTSVLEEDVLYQFVFLPDWPLTMGSRICGEIDVKHEGDLITSIPYEESFELFVDGEAVETKRVNMAFLGADVSKGKHRIEILYHAPGVRAGKMFSCIGIFFWMIMMIAERKRKCL